MTASFNKQLYIAVEGIDGSGKTTAVKFIEDLIRRKGHTCLAIREPGTTALGEKIRDIIKNLSILGYTPSDNVLSMLVNAARLDMLEQTVELAKERFILSDRCFISTIAYQNKSNINTLLCNLGTRNLTKIPDLIFILDVNYDTANSRVYGRGLKSDDILDAPSRAEFEKRRRIYLDFGRNSTDLKTRIVYIKGGQTREEVEEDIYKELCHYL